MMKLLGTLVPIWFFLITATSIFWIDNNLLYAPTLSKWYGTIFVFVIGGALVSAISLSLNDRIYITRINDNIEYGIIFICTIEAIVVLVRILGKTQDIEIGNIGNTIGIASCLCLSLPLGLRSSFPKNMFFRIILILSKVICIITLLYFHSRTSIICISIIAIRILKSGKYKKILLFSFPCIIILLLFYKTDSSVGRWFILKRSVEMVADHPLLGWGPNGFVAHYMEKQAEFFKEHPASEYVIFADNIHHPLNEFVLVGVNYGFVGLVILFTFLWFTFRYYKSHSIENSQTGLDLLIILLIFSFFSYPLLFPFTWIILLYSLICIFKEHELLHNSWLYKIIVIILPLIGIQSYRNYKEDVELNTIQKKALTGLHHKMIPRYAKLYNSGKNDYFFLYNYASVLYLTEEYNKALHIANECKNVFSDYDLCLLLADIYRDCEDYKNAKKWYYEAHYMCPSRFIPLYEIYMICKKQGKLIERKRIANQINDMPIKVKTKEAVWIKNIISSDI